MATTIQAVIDAKLKKEIQALAKVERRSFSNMAGYLLMLGRLKYYEQDLAVAKQPKEAVSA